MQEDFDLRIGQNLIHGAVFRLKFSKLAEKMRERNYNGKKLSSFENNRA